MNLNRIFTFLVPKDKVFYELFEKASANLLKVARALSDMLDTTTFEEREKYMKLLRDLEHAGDDITHDIFTQLSKNFITPFDREDIHYLATALDDIVDFIYGSATRMHLYKLQEATPAMKKLSETLVKQSEEIDTAVKLMRGMENIIRIREALVRIHSLENIADDVFDEAVAQLFVVHKDAMEIIKQKEVLANMETATDKCEDVANVIESIIIKVS
ncbi:MAG: DUF47 family protein [Chitinophagales bacterium]|nr:DUF47 family protein [Chitinophagales bacterium]MDW8418916.1 DUF47 family protein [Chitinophagales bacterium]